MFYVAWQYKNFICKKPLEVGIVKVHGLTDKNRGVIQSAIGSIALSSRISPLTWSMIFSAASNESIWRFYWGLLKYFKFWLKNSKGLLSVKDRSNGDASIGNVIQNFLAINFNIKLINGVVDSSHKVHFKRFDRNKSIIWHFCCPKEMRNVFVLVSQLRVARLSSKHKQK